MAFEKAYRAIERDDRNTVAGMLDRGELSIEDINKQYNTVL